MGMEERGVRTSSVAIGRAGIRPACLRARPAPVATPYWSDAQGLSPGLLTLASKALRTCRTRREPITRCDMHLEMLGIYTLSKARALTIRAMAQFDVLLSSNIAMVYRLVIWCIMGHMRDAVVFNSCADSEVASATLTLCAARRASC